MRPALVVLCFACAACEGSPRDAAGWARAAVRRSRTADKVEAIEQARHAPGDHRAALPHLVALLKEAPRVRGEAAAALGEIGDPAAVEPLAAAVDLSASGQRGELNEANRQIATALGALRARAAVPALLRLAAAGDRFTQVAAVDALGEVGDPAAVDTLAAMATADDMEPFTAKKALIALGKIADARAAPAVLEMVFRERRGVSFFPEASFAAYQIGAPMGPRLLAIVKGEDRELAAWARSSGVPEGALYAKAAQLLGDVGGEGAVAALVQKLGYRDPAPELQAVVRVYAAESLGRLRARPAVRPIGELLLAERDPGVRQRYCEALARIGDRAALPYLARAAAAGPWEARAGALEALSRLGGPAEAPALDAARRSEPSRAAEIGEMEQRLEAARQCREEVGCWSARLAEPRAAVRDRAALEVGWRGGPDQAEKLAAAAALPVAADADLTARYHALLALQWVTASGAPAAAALADRLDALVESEKGRAFTAGVNDEARRLSVRLRRQAGAAHR